MSQSWVTLPWTSVVLVCACTVGQLLFPDPPQVHQNGYQFGQEVGSEVSGSVAEALITPETPLFSSELVGSTTQPIQFCVVPVCVVS